MTAAAIAPEPVPLVRDLSGRLMVPGTRLSLDVLVADFKQGKTPESIHDSYESVSLADVYVIFAYYLRHRGEVEAYLAEQVRDGAEIQARIEANDRPEGLRARLIATSTREARVFATREYSPRPTSGAQRARWATVLVGRSAARCARDRTAEEGEPRSRM